jgi:hypothetical protein
VSVTPWRRKVVGGGGRMTTLAANHKTAQCHLRKQYLQIDKHQFSEEGPLS